MAKSPGLAPLHHGGGLQQAMQVYGGNVGEWSDLSTGINPHAAPIPQLDPICFERLPEKADYDATLKAAKAFYGVSGAGVLAAGTQPIIALLPVLAAGQKVQIIGPTYGEYAAAFAAQNMPFEYIDELHHATAPWVIVVNPDNPSCRILDQSYLLKAAEQCAARGGCLVVDEAFGDYGVEPTIASYAGMDGLLVLRSFGKFFGLAGVRLAAAFGDDDMMSWLQLRLGPWAVSGPALAIGSALYRDKKLHARLRADITTAHSMTRSTLEDAGLDVVGDAGLFMLIHHTNAHGLHRALAHHHILTRVFDYAPEWIRFGLCKNEQDVKKLSQRLRVSIQSLR